VEKQADGTIKLITIVQQIVSVLRTEDTEQERYSVIMRAIYGPVI